MTDKAIKRKFVALDPIQCGADFIAPGEPVELTDAEAAQALASKSVRPFDANHDGKADKVKGKAKAKAGAKPEAKPEAPGDGEGGDDGEGDGEGEGEG